MDIFDIVQDGAYNDFIENYNDDVTWRLINIQNLICYGTAMFNDSLPEKLKIIKYLLSEKVG